MLITFQIKSRQGPVIISLKGSVTTKKLGTTAIDLVIGFAAKPRPTINRPWPNDL